MNDKAEISSKLNYLQDKFMIVLQSIEQNELQTTIHETDEEWNTIEILRHIPVSEKEILELMQEVVQGSSGVSEEFDIDQENAEFRKEYASMGIDDIRQQMVEVRQRSLEFLENTAAEEWMKKGRYFNNEIMTVARMFQILMWHQNHHLKQIIDKLELEF